MSAKAVIVTGASRGLGLGIVQALLKDSHKVFLVARSEEDLRKLKTQYGDEVEYMSADLADLKVAPKVIGAAVKAFGKIDGLVINHGTISPIETMSGADAEAWRRTYDINVFGPVALVKEAIPELRKSKGRVVFVSSGASVGAFTGWSAYGSSKAALNHICAHLAVEEPSVTAVAVSPGKVDTDMQKEIREQGAASMVPEQHASFVAEHEEGRLLRPEQPGTVIAKLSVEAPRSLNGRHVRWNDAELAEFQLK